MHYKKELSIGECAMDNFLGSITFPFDLSLFL